MTLFPKLTRRALGWSMLTVSAAIIQGGIFLACVNNGTWLPLWFEGFIFFVFSGLWLAMSE